MPVIHLPLGPKSISSAIPLAAACSWAWTLPAVSVTVASEAAAAGTSRIFFTLQSAAVIVPVAPEPPVSITIGPPGLSVSFAMVVSLVEVFDRGLVEKDVAACGAAVSGREEDHGGAVVFGGGVDADDFIGRVDDHLIEETLGV